ncbi:MAG: FG-GAP repeat protein [Phycisphaerae bacterium]
MTPTAAHAQCDPQEAGALTASDAAADDWFGNVAIGGDTIVVGARKDDNATGVDAGAAYVYVKSGQPGSEVWTQQAKLIGNEPIFGLETGNQSGVSVDVSGNTAFVGSWLWPQENATGLIYIFERSGPPGGEVWTQTHAYACPQFGSFQYFGVSVSLEGDTAVVGALIGAGLNVGGQAFFYTRSGPPGGESWTVQQKFPSDGVPGDNFGVSVAMSPSQDTAVVGASAEDNAGGTDAGSAYVFVRSGNNWTEQAKLTASDGAALDEFGRQVAIVGDTIVVGARWDDHAGGANAGSAYVFTRSGTVWTQQAKLIASDAAAGDEFGLALTLSGDTLIVGAYSDDHAGRVDAGSAYVFTRTCSPGGDIWIEQFKLTAPDAAAGDVFGGSVALSGNTAVVSSFFDDNAGGIDAGSVYVFDLACTGAPCPDINGNDAVDLTDLATLLARFGTLSCATFAHGDFDDDGDVDLTDLATLLANFGSTCP